MTIDEVSSTLLNGFHDADLMSVRIDFAGASADLDFNIDLCDPHKEVEVTSRRGILHLSNLVYFVIEPPSTASVESKQWITADSSDLSELKETPKLLEPLPAGAFSHWFYSSTNNNFIYVAALNTSFEWVENG